MIEIVYDRTEKELLEMMKTDNQKKGEIGEVLCISGLFDIGNIHTPFDSDIRKQIYFEMNKYTTSKEEMEVDWNRLQENLICLKKYAEKKEKFRIWYSNAPHSICGFYFICNFLEEYHCKISIIQLPKEFIIPKGLRTNILMRELEPKLLYQCLDLEKELQHIQIIHYSNEWNMLLEDNSPLRALINGQLIGVPVDFYDFMIRKVMPKEEIKVITLIANVLDCYEIGISDIWLYKRILYLIEMNEFELIGGNKAFEMIIKEV